MVAVAGYGFIEGNPKLLLTTYDADGNGCGMNETTKEYPYLYFPIIDLEAAKSFQPTAADLSAVLGFATCVKSCPDAATSQPVVCSAPKFMTDNTKQFKNCEYYIGETEFGQPFRYETTLFASKFCVPSSEALKNGTVQAF